MGNLDRVEVGSDGSTSRRVSLPPDLTEHHPAEDQVEWRDPLGRAVPPPLRRQGGRTIDGGHNHTVRSRQRK